GTSTSASTSQNTVGFGHGSGTSLCVGRAVVSQRSSTSFPSSPTRRSAVRCSTSFAWPTSGATSLDYSFSPAACSISAAPWLPRSHVRRTGSESRALPSPAQFTHNLYAQPAASAQQTARGVQRVGEVEGACQERRRALIGGS